MLDPKAVAEAMDYIVERIEASGSFLIANDSDDLDRRLMNATRFGVATGEAVGAAKAVRLLCEAEGKPVTRGTDE